MQGDQKVDELMRPVHAAIKRHVKDGTAVTDIYNRAYEAVMEVQDTLIVSAAVTAQQIAENAKNLQRAEAAEARAERLQAALRGLMQFHPEDELGPQTEEYWTPEYKAAMDAARDALKGGEE